MKRLNELRANRNSEEVQQILERITLASSDGSNLFPLILEAVRMNASLGEIMAAMKQVFGTYSAPSGFLGEINETTITIDHIEIASTSLEGSQFWRLIGLTAKGEDDHVEDQGVVTRYSRLGKSNILKRISKF